MFWGFFCTYLEISQDTDVMCNNISEYHKVQFVWIVKTRLQMQSGGKWNLAKNQEANPKQKQTKSKQSNWQNYDED